MFYIHSSRLLFLCQHTGARLCRNDFTTEGLCYMAVDQAKSWHAAKKHCQEGLSQPGSLAAIYDQPSQAVVAEEVDRQGWPDTWINGCLKDRLWYFQRRKFLLVIYTLFPRTCPESNYPLPEQSERIDPRDQSLLTEGGGLQNGKILCLKLFLRLSP